jgi:hypothetical protein
MHEKVDDAKNLKSSTISTKKEEELKNSKYHNYTESFEHEKSLINDLKSNVESNAQE